MWQDVRLSWGVSKLYAAAQGEWANQVTESQHASYSPCAGQVTMSHHSAMSGTLSSQRGHQKIQPQHMKTKVLHLGGM